MINIPWLHHFISLMETNRSMWNGEPLTERLQATQQLPTKQPRRKTGVAQARRIARKRRNRK